MSVDDVAGRGVWCGKNSTVLEVDGFCCRDVALIVTVMVVGWSNVESFGAVVSPGWAFICLVVNNNFAACRL